MVVLKENWMDLEWFKYRKLSMEFSMALFKRKCECSVGIAQWSEFKQLAQARSSRCYSQQLVGFY